MDAELVTLEQVGGALAVLGTVLAGLSAGVFLAFSAGVMAGLNRAGDDRTYVEAMRGINRAVVNPAFLLPIFLAPVVLLAAGVVQASDGRAVAGGLLIGAGTVGLLGTVVVTVARSIPLNDRLERSTRPDAEIRAFFHRPWLRLNHLRTLSATLALILAALSFGVG